MKLLLRLTPMVLIVLGMFFMVGCEDTSEDEDVNPLVGEWAISNLEQASTYTMADDSFAPVFAAGDTVGSGALTWAEFSAMGVSGTVTLLEDGTFTLAGNFPIANDTLGYAPAIVPLTDAGSWIEDETAGTLLIDGAFYDLGGLMTWSDDENMISLAYQSAEVDTLYLPAGPHFWAGPMNVYTSSMLGFTRQ